MRQAQRWRRRSVCNTLPARLVGRFPAPQPLSGLMQPRANAALLRWSPSGRVARAGVGALRMPGEQHAVDCLVPRGPAASSALCVRCATLYDKKQCCGAMPPQQGSPRSRVGVRRGERWYGKMMFRSQDRFAVTIVFALAAVSLATASARAFSQESGGPGGSENSTFSDPDEQVNIFGQGAEPQSFGSNGSVQYDPGQRGRLNALKHLQINSLTSPPDPLSRPGN
jgi:hypothetical protein